MNLSLKDRIHSVIATGRPPIAVLDVDLTLVENAPRTRAILRDYALSLADTWPEASVAAERAADMPLVFSITENLKRLGFSTEDYLRAGFEFWKRTFFTEAYCRLDEPLPGAAEAVMALKEEGCTIVYVTARTGEMLTGTVASFRKFGFPIGVTGTVLTLKDSPQQPDKAFKAEALSWVSQLGTVVLCAENEPAYINLMKTTFPDSFCLLVDTRHSPSAPPLDPRVQRVKGLESFVMKENQGGCGAVDT